MKKYLIIIMILFSLCIIASNKVFFKLMEEGDYYRAVGEYKKISFYNGIEDTAAYYLVLSSIYALSDFNNITEEIYSKASYSINSMEQLEYASLLKGYIDFKNGEYRSSILGMESFLPENDSIMISLHFLLNMIEKIDSVYTIPSIFPDSIKDDLMEFSKYRLKSPQRAVFLSSIIPGLGEIYAGDYKSGIRDFIITNVFTALSVYAVLKNRNDFSISKFEASWDYIKSRDYVFIFVMYSIFLSRFQNGSTTNAMEAVYEYNDNLYKKYLMRLYDFIDSIFKNRILTYIYSNV